MPRKGHIQKRDVLADPVYKNKIVTKLINNIMLDGKKGVAQKIVYGAFEQVAEQTGKDALEVFDEAMNNVMPELEVKARRIGGSTYQVPIEVRPDRRQALALRWLTTYSRARGEKTMKERLAKAFFYDGLFTPGEFPAQFDGAVVRGILEKFLQTYDPADDAAVWFDKVKALTAEAGFCADMKAYKADPAAWPGSVADVSTFLRIAVTGKTNSPDLYTVMQLLGSERTAARIRAAMDRL